MYDETKIWPGGFAETYFAKIYSGDWVVIVSTFTTGQECDFAETLWKWEQMAELRVTGGKNEPEKDGMEGGSIRESAENGGVIAIWQREKEESDRRVPQEKNCL